MSTEFPTAPKIHPVIRERWSPRDFDRGRPVEMEKIRALLEAARWAPSSYNVQPWRFLVFDGGDPEALVEARSCLYPGNAWARQAPVLILTVAQVVNPARGSENRNAVHDLGLATENLLLQAVAEGLAAHPMAGFDKERARQLFGIPDGYEPWVMIAVGHPKGSGKPPERRPRLPLEEIAFRGRWGRPLDASDEGGASQW